jgi:hypothetical protein
LSFSGYRVTYHRPASALGRSFSKTHGLGGKDKLVTGDNRFPQFYLVHAQQYSQLTGVFQPLRK